MKKLGSLLIVLSFGLFFSSEIASVSDGASLGSPTLQTIRGGKYYLHLPVSFTDQTTPVQITAVAKKPTQASASMRGKTLVIALSELTDLEVEIKGDNFVLNRFLLKRELEGLVKQWTANILWGKYLTAKEANTERQLLQKLFHNASEAYQELEAYHPGYAKGALKILAQEEEQFLRGLSTAEKSTDVSPSQQVGTTRPVSPPVSKTVVTPTISPVISAPFASAERTFSEQSAQVMKASSSKEMTVLPKETSGLKTERRSRRGEISAWTAFPTQTQDLGIPFFSWEVWTEFRQWLTHTPLFAFPVTLLLLSLLEGILVVLLILSLLYLVVSQLSIPAEWPAVAPYTPATGFAVDKAANVPWSKNVERFRSQVQERLLLQEKQLEEMAAFKHQAYENLAAVRKTLVALQGHFNHNSREIEQIKKLLARSAKGKNKKKYLLIK